MIKDKNDKVVTSVKSSEDSTNEFPITTSFYQGITLIPYLFALIMYELIGLLQIEVPWHILFANDII